MIIKKSGGKIFGAKLSPNEQKALDLEIGRQLAEYDESHELEICSLVMWELHERFGWGEKRLHDFFLGFDKGLHELIKRYEMSPLDDAWVCSHKLKEYGIDLEKWQFEVNKN